MPNVFVAPKIRVGFQNRSDTFTGQLAYIIYYDEKGKLRKEKSWESWRDKKIDTKEFDNVPTEGFTINKDIKRYSGDWFSSTRTMIRIHDPRGFEFEVTTENLIGILMHTDCLRRGLIGEFVYAWMGTELVLLPTNSEEYQKAVKYTFGLSKKVSAKELVPGISYKTKREGNVIYIGRMTWYSYKDENWYYCNWDGPRKEQKVHVFTSDDGKTFFKKPSVDFLAEPNSDTPVSNYASLVDKYNKKLYSKKILRYEFRSTSFDTSTTKDNYYGRTLCRKSYWVPSPKRDKLFVQIGVHAVADIQYNPTTGRREPDSAVVTEYTVDETDAYHDYSGIIEGTTEFFQIKADRDNAYFNRRGKTINPEEMMRYKLYDLYAIFESGEEKRIDKLDELSDK
jgi:hypothetical protein